MSCQILSAPKSCPPKIMSPLLQQYYAHAIFQPHLIGTVLLHRSLGLQTVYERVLGCRLSYRTAVKKLYIAIHVIRSLYAFIYGWGTQFWWDIILTWQWAAMGLLISSLYKYEVDIPTTKYWPHTLSCVTCEMKCRARTVEARMRPAESHVTHQIASKDRRIASEDSRSISEDRRSTSKDRQSMSA